MVRLDSNRTRTIRRISWRLSALISNPDGIVGIYDIETISPCFIYSTRLAIRRTSRPRHKGPKRGRPHTCRRHTHQRCASPALRYPYSHAGASPATTSMPPWRESVADLEAGRDIALISRCRHSPEYRSGDSCLSEPRATPAWRLNALPGATAFRARSRRQRAPLRQICLRGFLPLKKGRATRLAELCRRPKDCRQSMSRR